MKIAKQIVVFILLVSICVSMVPMTASASGTIAWGAANASGDGVRIRSGPGLDKSVLTHVNRGEVIVILERTNSEWNKVSFHGTVGYVSVALLENPRKVINFTAQGSITGNNVNMRSKPDTSSSILGTYTLGTVMTIIGLNEGWYKVQSGGNTGYVRSDFMQITSRSGGTGGTAPASTTTQGSIAGSNVNMRAKPDTSSSILGTYRLGTIMTVIGESNGWYNVQYDGKTGYIRADLLQVPPGNTAAAPSAASSLGQQIADFAKSFTGTKYLYGGSSPSGFDCSGLVSYVCKQFGISVTRRASGQYSDNGVHIKKSELVPGDLVFFSSNGRTVTHVGIYIGNNKFVHASNTRVGVVVSDLGSSYYTRVWFGAKRIV